MFGASPNMTEKRKSESEGGKEAVNFQTRKNEREKGLGGIKKRFGKINDKNRILR